jgi:hypothetical protein
VTCILRYVDFMRKDLLRKEIYELQGDWTYAVIPDRDIVWLPFESYLELVVLADLSEEKPKYRV